ncbi:MAG: glycosyltransferase [Candidatus Hodarchaeota archaeon]
MRIAMIRPVRDPVRLETYNIQEIGLAKSLLNMGVSTDIFIQINTRKNTFVEFEKKMGNLIRIYSLAGVPLFGRNEYYPQLFKILCSNGYDFIQSLDDNMLMSVLIITWAKKNGIKTILRQGMYECFTGYKKVIQKIYDFHFQGLLKKSVDLAIAKTNTAADYLEAKGFKNIHVLPVGLDFREFERRESVRDGNLEEFKNKNSKILLYVGKIERRRQVDFLIRVLNEIREQINTGLVIVGDGPERSRMEEIVVELDLADRVLFTGKVPQTRLSSIYNLADVFLLASRYEIVGMVVLEALYHGLPVISTRTGGPLDILKKEHLGCCVDKNVTIWSQVIMDAFDNECEKHRIRRKQYIREKYDWNKLARRYLDIIGE